MKEEMKGIFLDFPVKVLKRMNELSVCSSFYSNIYIYKFQIELYSDVINHSLSVQN